MELKDKPSFDSVTEEQIEAWKQKFPEGVKQYDIAVDDTEETKESYIIRRPNKTLISAVGRYAKENKSDKAEQLMINSCVLAGDINLLKADQDVFYTLLSKLGDEVSIRNVEVKKL